MILPMVDGSITTALQILSQLSTGSGGTRGGAAQSAVQGQQSAALPPPPNTTVLELPPSRLPPDIQNARQAVQILAQDIEVSAARREVTVQTARGEVVLRLPSDANAPQIKQALEQLLRTQAQNQAQPVKVLYTPSKPNAVQLQIPLPPVQTATPPSQASTQVRIPADLASLAQNLPAGTKLPAVTNQRPLLIQPQILQNLAQSVTGPQDTAAPLQRIANVLKLPSVLVPSLLQKLTLAQGNLSPPQGLGQSQTATSTKAFPIPQSTSLKLPDGLTREADARPLLARLSAALNTMSSASQTVSTTKLLAWQPPGSGTPRPPLLPLNPQVNLLFGLVIGGGQAGGQSLDVLTTAGLISLETGSAEIPRVLPGTGLWLQSSAPASSLNRITTPQTAIPQQAWNPATGGSWPALDEVIQTLMQQAETAPLAQGIQSTLPTAANPTQLTAAVLFFMTALKMNAPQKWVGDKALEALKAQGKDALLTRFTRDFAAAGQTREAPTAPQSDWRQLPMPFVSDGALERMQMFIRSDSDEQDEGVEGAGGSKRTRFLMNLTMSKLGQLQVDGLTQDKRLDVILRTKEPLSAVQRQAMRQHFHSGLERGNIAGHLSFADQGWVKVPQMVSEIGSG